MNDVNNTLKILTLDQLKEMSNNNIDKILELYNKGYKLEGGNNNDLTTALQSEIHTLQPYVDGQIVAATAFGGGTLPVNTTRAWVFYHHNPTSVNTYIHVKGTISTTEGHYRQCITFANESSDGLLRATPRSSETWGGGPIIIAAASASTIVSSFTCSTSPNCTASPVSCSSESAINSITIPTPITYDTTTPNPATSVNVTPGEGSLTITWTPPTNVPIQAYYIWIIKTGDTLPAKAGWWLASNPNSFTATGLAGNTQYDIYVTPASTSTIPASTPAAIQKTTLAISTSTKKTTNWTPLIIAGTVLAAAYILLTPSKKEEPTQIQTQQQQLYGQYQYGQYPTRPELPRPVPVPVPTETQMRYRTYPPEVYQYRPEPIYMEAPKPPRPLTNEEISMKIMEQKEDAVKKDIHKLAEQKEDIKRLKELEKKRNEIKTQITNEYLEK